jgi:RNA-directed DNA polymerase
VENEVTQQKSESGANLSGSGESHGNRENAQKVTSTIHGLEILRKKVDLLEEVLSRKNLLQALKQTRGNKGASGIDKMSCEDLPGFLKSDWPRIKEELMRGTYSPHPVRLVEIPKENGGVRKLGVPVVLDRLIQQALMQVLQGYIDPSFSDHSYGFRPGRSAHQAIQKSQQILSEGYEIMVDIDLEKFFDRVNHDKLMSKLHGMIGDPRVLYLIRKYLNSGIQSELGFVATKEGVPQGSPLSPLLSNIVLDDLDKELERRGHRFVRYADDCKTFVHSHKAGERVMESISEYLNTKLKLQVNKEKSSVGKVGKFLGFNITKEELTVTKRNLENFKDKIRDLTKIRGGQSLEGIIKNLNPVLRGWREYFKPQTAKTLFKRLDGWVRRRVRGCYYKQLKNGHTRLSIFIKAKVSYDTAHKCAYSSLGIWRMSRCEALQRILNNNRLKGMGLVNLDLR